MFCRSFFFSTTPSPPLRDAQIYHPGISASLKQSHVSPEITTIRSDSFSNSNGSSQVSNAKVVVLRSRYHIRPSSAARALAPGPIWLLRLRININRQAGIVLPQRHWWKEDDMMELTATNVRVRCTLGLRQLGQHITEILALKLARLA